MNLFNSASFGGVGTTSAPGRYGQPETTDHVGGNEEIDFTSGTGFGTYYFNLLERVQQQHASQLSRLSPNDPRRTGLIQEHGALMRALTEQQQTFAQLDGAMFSASVAPDLGFGRALMTTASDLRQIWRTA